MNQINVAGHDIEFKGNKLIIDGQVADVKLKRSLFGGDGGVSIVSKGNVYQNGGNKIIRGSAKIKFGRNTIVITSKNVIVNGEKVADFDQEMADEQSLDEILNKTARKYLISTAKEDEIKFAGEICRRIIALNDIANDKGEILVKKGQKGGYVAGRENLSEYGTCWIYDDAVAAQNSFVEENAKLKGRAAAYGESIISGNSELSGYATVHGNVSTTNNVRVAGNADVHGNVFLSGNVRVLEDAKVHGNASASGNVEISGSASVHGNTSLSGSVKISGDADLNGNIALSGNNVITSSRQLSEKKKANSFVLRNSVIKDSIISCDDMSINISGSVKGDIVISDFDDFEDEDSKY